MNDEWRRAPDPRVLADLAAWVEWLEEAYAPWVVLPPCWPAHEGLRAELTLFWRWYSRWITERPDSSRGGGPGTGPGGGTGGSADPEEGIRWHADLRRAAEAWRALATCDHRPPGPEHTRLREARRAERDRRLAAATDGADG